MTWRKKKQLCVQKGLDGLLCCTKEKSPCALKGVGGAQLARRSAAGPEPACVLALGPTARQPVSLLWRTEELHFTEEPALRCRAAGAEAA